jgi:imidazole glycerol-phosphate synthase subunit HisH
LSITNYNGFEYASSVMKDNIWGFQFHPEKSSEKGLTIYKNFFNI